MNDKVQDIVVAVQKLGEELRDIKCCVSAEYRYYGYSLEKAKTEEEILLLIGAFYALEMIREKTKIEIFNPYCFNQEIPLPSSVDSLLEKHFGRSK